MGAVGNQFWIWSSRNSIGEENKQLISLAIARAEPIIFSWKISASQDTPCKPRRCGEFFFRNILVVCLIIHNRPVVRILTFRKSWFEVLYTDMWRIFFTTSHNKPNSLIWNLETWSFFEKAFWVSSIASFSLDLTSTDRSHGGHRLPTFHHDRIPWPLSVSSLGADRWTWRRYPWRNISEDYEGGSEQDVAGFWWPWELPEVTVWDPRRDDRMAQLLGWQSSLGLRRIQLLREHAPIRIGLHEQGQPFFSFKTTWLPIGVIVVCGVTNFKHTWKRWIVWCYELIGSTLSLRLISDSEIKKLRLQALGRRKVKTLIFYAKWQSWLRIKLPHLWWNLCSIPLKLWYYFRQHAGGVLGDPPCPVLLQSGIFYQGPGRKWRCPADDGGNPEGWLHDCARTRAYNSIRCLESWCAWGTGSRKLLLTMVLNHMSPWLIVGFSKIRYSIFLKSL